MKIFNNSELRGRVQKPVLTIGTFDGVHVGHQEILSRLIKEARRIGGESVLFTFHPHPREVIFPDNHGLKMITSQDEKMDYLSSIGLDSVILFPFTKGFSELTAEEFVKKILVDQIGVSKVVIGYDHHFGKNRKGNIHLLKEFGLKYNFEVEEISAQEVDEINVSSTKIRKSLQEGMMEVVNSYLGRPYEINGLVVEGNQLGRSLGFPTANIEVDDAKKMLPVNGVYVVEVEFEDQIYRGMMNIGFNPTHNLKKEESIEVFIHDFDRNIYGEALKVRVHKKIRDEKKFLSPEELKNQLKKDADYSLTYSV